jgi:hypothetical protein
MTRLTVIYKDLNTWVHTGVGPTVRRQTIALTDEQVKQLSPKSTGYSGGEEQFEVIDMVFLETDDEVGDE